MPKLVATFSVVSLLLVEDHQLVELVVLLQDSLALLHVAVVFRKSQQGRHQRVVGEHVALEEGCVDDLTQFVARKLRVFSVDKSSEHHRFHVWLRHLTSLLQ